MITLDLPKKQSEIDSKIKGLYRKLMAVFLLGVFGAIAYGILLAEYVIIQRSVTLLLGAILFILVLFSLILFYFNVKAVQYRLQELTTLTREELEEYGYLCTEYPTLSQYNTTLQRSPVLKELEEFRRFVEKQKFEELKNRVRNMKGAGDPLKDWSIKRQSCGGIVVKHKDGSGVYVEKNDQDNIAASIMYRLASDLLKNDSKKG